MYGLGSNIKSLFESNSLDLSKYKKLKLLIENQVSYHIFNILKKNNSLDVENDICKKLKAIKNSAEILCSEKAHIQDGLALVKFFYWIEKNIDCNSLSRYNRKGIQTRFE
mgnify:CR=1 FL=1